MVPPALGLVILGLILAGLLESRFATAAPYASAPEPEANASAALAARIVGGSGVTRASDFPFIASMHDLEGRFAGCSGTILSAAKIVLAAHCVHGERASYLRFRVGSLNKNRGELLPLSGYKFHPKYSLFTEDYDVAVATLESPLTFPPNVRPATLVPLGSDIDAGQEIEVAGWGQTSVDSSTTPSRLRKVAVRASNHTECASAYGNIRTVTDRMFCAQADGKASCTGDSGGPVVDKMTRVLLGAVSWARSCADPKYPVVNTNFADPEIQKFIKEHL